MWRLADLVHHSCRGSAYALLHAEGCRYEKRHILGDLEERHSDVGCTGAAELSQLVTDSETSL